MLCACGSLRSMSTLTIQLPDDLASRLERVSAERHVAPSQVVSECLAKGLPSQARRQPTGFLKKWGGTIRKIDDPTDARLTHTNEKHLR